MKGKKKIEINAGKDNLNIVIRETEGSGSKILTLGLDEAFDLGIGLLRAVYAKRQSEI